MAASTPLRICSGEVVRTDGGKGGRPWSAQLEHADIRDLAARRPHGFLNTDDGTIGGIDTVQQKLVAATISRASALRQQAITTAAGVGAAVLIVLLLALVFTAIGRRSKRTVPGHQIPA